MLIFFFKDIEVTGWSCLQSDSCYNMSGSLEKPKVFPKPSNLNGLE